MSLCLRRPSNDASGFSPIANRARFGNVPSIMEIVFNQLAAGKALTPQHIELASSFLVDPNESPDVKAKFLRALAKKGETPDEIAGFVQEFLKLAVDPGIDRSKLQGPVLDVVGTGGDKLNLFNVSTTAMFILAAGGVCVAKHGNRSITSKAGGADVLEALGIRIDLPPDRVAQGLEIIGLGFFFAPAYHPAFKAVADARKILAAQGQRSIFNVLGPLLNPAKPDYQLIGVFDANLTRPFGEILKTLGRKGAWIVHGSANDSGMDELSTLGKTKVCKLAEGKLTEAEIDPRSLGLAAARLEDLVGGDAIENGKIIEGILAGEIKGAKREIAALNAAAGFVITGKAKDLAEGLAMAAEILDRGAAHARMRVMQDWC